MLYGDTDPFNAADRYDVLINEDDAKELDIEEEEAIVVYNKYGTFHGRAKYAKIKEGNIGLHWPEGNQLIPEGVYEEHAGIPEYSAAAIVEKAETFHRSEEHTSELQSRGHLVCRLLL